MHSSYGMIRFALFLATAFLFLGTGCATTQPADSASEPEPSFVLKEALTAIPPLPEDAGVYFEYQVAPVPRIVGGLDAVLDSVAIAPNARTESAGRVIISFIVGPDGTLFEPTIKQSLNPYLDAAALRALNAVQWVPGRFRGRPVFTWSEVTISFRSVRVDV